MKSGRATASWRLIIATWLGFIAGLPQPASAGETELTSQQVVAGHSRALWSTTLQEERRLLISLPQHYAQSKRSYPVLFMLDGEQQFLHIAGTLQYLSSTWIERMPEMILVAIVNTDRSRDFLPPGSKPEREGIHAADKFLAFIADELIPWTTANYRTEPYRVLLGHSDGGLFTSYALANRPETFQAYAALSPALNGDKVTAAKLESVLRTATKPPPLFLSWSGTDYQIRTATQELVTSLSKKPVQGRWTHREYLQDTHASTFHRASYDALEWLFDGWNLSNPLTKGAFEPTVAQVDAHYAGLSQRFGFKVTPPTTVIHRAAQALLKKKDLLGALAVYRRAADDYPYLADAHAQVGRVLEQLGRVAEARQAYEQALNASLSAGDAYDDSPRYREKLRQLQP